MARVLKGSHSFTCTPRVHPLTEWTIPAFAFSAEAGTHLPTPEGWKAELAFGGWLVTYWNRCPAPGIEPDTVTHLSTNRARRRLTSLIKANVPTTTPDHQTNTIKQSIKLNRKSYLGPRIAKSNPFNRSFENLLSNAHSHDELFMWSFIDIAPLSEDKSPDEE